MKLNRKGSLPFILLVVLVFAACAATTSNQSSTLPKKLTVAVWDIDNFSPTSSEDQTLGEIFSSQIIETLLLRGEYQVVERERLLLALEELQMSSTSLVDEATRLQLGKLLGARVMILGGFIIIEDTMRFDLRLVEVETGKVLKAVQKTSTQGDLMERIETAKEAVIALLLPD